MQTEDKRSVERAARNEVIFRDANEDIEEARSQLGVEGRTPYVCECEAEDCTELLLLSTDEYGRARAAPRRFVIAAGHPTRQSRLVEDGGGFVIVEKHGLSGAIAEREA
jgi:hypothetical protein